uniref:Uncharacterized protein n=1 Tax=Panagrolaimus sp. PS1159 TaxID=55785 RepID=A0AC35GPP3_9BILA
MLELEYRDVIRKALQNFPSQAWLKEINTEIMAFTKDKKGAKAGSKYYVYIYSDAQKMGNIATLTFKQFLYAMIYGGKGEGPRIYIHLKEAIAPQKFPNKATNVC